MLSRNVFYCSEDSCPGGYYCDPGSSICHSCNDICQHYVHSDCQHLCPGFEPTTSPAVFSTQVLSTASISTPTTSSDLYLVIILTVICIVVIIVIAVIVCFIYVNRTSNSIPAIPYGSQGLAVTPTTASVIHLPQDNTEKETSHTIQQHIELKEHHPQQRLPEYENKRLTMQHIAEADVHEETTFSVVKPKDPHRSTKMIRKDSSSGSEKHNTGSKVSVPLAVQDRRKKSSVTKAYNSPKNVQPVKLDQSTNTVAEPLLKSSGSQTINTNTPRATQPSRKSIFTQFSAGVRNDESVSNQQSRAEAEIQPLLSNENQETNKKINTETENVHSSNIDKSKILGRRQNLLPKSKRGKEPRFDIDLYSMELEPEDKDPFEKANQRRHLKKKQKERAEASPLVEDFRNEAENLQLDIATALAPIKMRHNEIEQTTVLDDSVTELKNVRPSLVLQETGKKEVENLTPSVDEDVPDLLIARTQGINDEPQSKVQISQSIEDAMTAHDQIIRSHLRRARFVKEHIYHGTEEPIDVYVDPDVQSFWALSELVQITGEKPSRYRIKHKEYTTS